MAKSRQRERESEMLVALYCVAIFLSALLLFVVQPMFARMMLPLLGGSPYVWNTALVFFQGALLMGYLYAHLSTRWLGIRRQAALHALVLLCPLVLLPIALRAAPPSGDASPVLWLLGTMLVSIGLPFFVVSSTSPLLQRWFAGTGHKDAADPYFLYVWSNFGSLAALVLYPVVLEPQLTLGAQSGVWSIGYGVLIVAMVACAFAMWRAPQAAATSEPVPEDPDLPRLKPPTARRRVRWVALAFVPSSLMVGVTTYLTTDIASAPLLWVLPLGLYLVSFMIVFNPKPVIPHKLMVWLLPWFLAATLIVFASGLSRPALPLGSLCMVALFVTAMVFHGELARDRPSVSHLTEFFLLISVGGVLGGAFAALLAPAVFVLVIEYSLTLVLAGFLMPRSSDPRRRGIAPLDVAAPLLAFVGIALLMSGKAVEVDTATQKALAMVLPAGIAIASWKHPVRFGLCLAGMFVVGTGQLVTDPNIVLRERSFFGTLTVYERTTVADTFHEMSHGTTLHGRQSLDPERRDIPISYYDPAGPVGDIFRAVHLQPGSSVAVVGLGTGTLAAYGKAGQNWTYYEIDPNVVRVARNRRIFTYIDDCPAHLKIVLGDARLSMQKQSDRYDLLLLDAYSSDAIPVHLMTLEALDLYLKHLTSHGVIVFHVSNRHLDLPPVVAALAHARGLVSLIRYDLHVSDEESDMGKSPSDWMVVARSKADVGSIGDDPKWEPPTERPGLRVWTDDYSNIFEVLNILS